MSFLNPISASVNHLVQQVNVAQGTQRASAE
jgi:hypothetical protein